MLRALVGAPASGAGFMTRRSAIRDGIARLDERLRDHDDGVSLRVERRAEAEVHGAREREVRVDDRAVGRGLGDDAAAADVERPRLHAWLERGGDGALDRAERVADVCDVLGIDLRRAAAAPVVSGARSGLDRRSFTS